MLEEQQLKAGDKINVSGTILRIYANGSIDAQVADGKLIRTTLAHVKPIVEASHKEINPNAKKIETK